MFYEINGTAFINKLEKIRVDHYIANEDIASLEGLPDALSMTFMNKDGKPEFLKVKQNKKSL